MPYIKFDKPLVVYRFCNMIYHDVKSGSDMILRIIIDKPLVVYRFWETLWNDTFNVKHMAKP